MTGQTLAFGACQDSYCLNIPIINNNEVEKDKTFRVTVGRTPDLQRRVIVNPTRADVTIIDDDGMCHSTPGVLVHVHTLMNLYIICSLTLGMHAQRGLL